MNLGILASGNLGLHNLIHLFNQKYQIEFILSDKHSSGIIDFARQHNIPYFIGNPRNRKASDFIKNFQPDVIISINYLFIIEEDVFSLPKILSFNIHGSLLPKYRGRTPHVWAIINDEKQTGITAHIIDKGCDTGDVLEQLHVPIDDKDTGNDILMKYIKLYPQLLDSVLTSIQNNTFKRIKQDEKNATYFPKRTPEDGLINWDWDQRKIYNWIRAQSKPYPGAFSYINNTKTIIHNSEQLDLPMNHSGIKNGTITDVTSNSIIVKTNDGYLKLFNIENFEQIKLSVGQLFQNNSQS